MNAPQRAPIFPHEHVPVARDDGPIWLHAVELAAPVALGQRALIVGPPGSGKTTLLHEIGRSLLQRVPGLEAHVVIVDQRPEERGEWRRWLPGATVHGTTSDASPAEHADVAHVFGAATELSGAGGNVLVLIDSLAALARAFNATAEESDRVLTGGLLASALREVRMCFGAGRALHPDGSLTVIATAAVDTGAELDEVVFQELVGTGNMEIRLSGEAMAAGLFPPLDIGASGARRDDDILGLDEADRRASLRGKVSAHGTTAGLQLLLHEIERAGSLDRVGRVAESDPS